MSSKGQPSHLGERAGQISRPKRIHWWFTSFHSSRGRMARRSCSVLSGSLAWVFGESPSRWAMRFTWVSTAMPSTMPKLTLSTMLAVFRPTPGRRVSSPIVRGTSPPKSETIAWAHSTQWRALVL